MARGNHRSWWTRLILFFGRWILVLGLLAAIVIGGYGALLAPTTPTTSELKAFHKHQSSVLLSSEGETITHIGRRGREWLALEDISPHVVDALIATEDRRFYTHGGIDLRRTAAAILFTVLGDRQGGSTLTQQLARNMYPEKIGSADPLTRKLREIITARKLESIFSKDEILETYLNTVPFLYNAFGIERAARTYFDKPAGELTITESATLVGMLKGTSYYNPVRHPERARSRRNLVLYQMSQQGKISPERYETLREEPLTVNFHSQLLRDSIAPHFAEHVRKQVKTWAEEQGYDIYTDGLTIHTTLNAELQRMAGKAVDRWGTALQHVADVEWGRSTNQLLSTETTAYTQYRDRVEPFGTFWQTRPELLQTFIRESSRYRHGVNSGVAPAVMMDSLQQNQKFLDSLRSTKTRLEIGLTAVAPMTGHIKAWVGSRDYVTDQFDHVVRARRQPGSTFKPFVYAAALEKGYSPNDSLPDRPITITTDDGGRWQPVNATGISGTNVTLRQALSQSKNTVTARLTQEIGPSQIVTTAQRLGVDRSPLRAVPSVGLGTSEVTLLEMVSAYATIANEGVRVEPLAITHIEDSSGRVVARFDASSSRALAEETALTMIDMMREVVDEGTGAGARHRFNLTGDLAGKTGTTQDGADGWFIMAHPELVAGSWVGFNDPRVTFRSSYWGQGAHNGLYVVSDLFEQAFRGGTIASSTRFPDPPGYPDEDDPPAIAQRVGQWLGKVANRIGDAIRGSREPAPEDSEPGSEPEPETDGSSPGSSAEADEPTDDSQQQRRGGW